MNDHSIIQGTRTGTVSGTLLVILSNIHLTDIIQTSVLAGIGATVSFGITLLLKWVVKKWKKR